MPRPRSKFLTLAQCAELDHTGRLASTPRRSHAERELKEILEKIREEDGELSLEERQDAYMDRPLPPAATEFDPVYDEEATLAKLAAAGVKPNAEGLFLEREVRRVFPGRRGPKPFADDDSPGRHPDQKAVHALALYLCQNEPISQEALAKEFGYCGANSTGFSQLLRNAVATLPEDARRDAWERRMRHPLKDETSK